MEEAREFQQAMLPKEMPKNDSYDIVGFQQTATEVGGDFFDFMQREDGSWVAICGDATGHGLTSGNVVSITKTAPFSELNSSKSKIFKHNIFSMFLCHIEPAYQEIMSLCPQLCLLAFRAFFENKTLFFPICSGPGAFLETKCQGFVLFLVIIEIQK